MTQDPRAILQKVIRFRGRQAEKALESGSQEKIEDELFENELGNVRRALEAYEMAAR